MFETFLTLAELAERSGVEIRTLRSWMAQGVIPGAETAGRNARYPAAALPRARAVRAMRDIYGMSLAEIRQDLLTADEARINSYADMAAAAPESSAAEGSATPPAQAGASAADYLRGLRGAGVFGAAAQAPPAPLHSAGAPASSAARPAGSRLARLAETLEKLAAPKPPRRKARAEIHLHIPITPDLELAVRGDHPPEDIARFERIADLLRALITGEADHD